MYICTHVCVCIYIYMYTLQALPSSLYANIADFRVEISIRNTLQVLSCLVDFKVFDFSVEMSTRNMFASSLVV